MVNSSRLPAGLVWAATLIFTLLCLVLCWLNHLALVRFFAEYILASLLGGLAFSGVGGLVISRQPGNRVGWLMSAAGVGLAFSVALEQYTRYVMVTRPGEFQGAALVAWLNAWSWFPILGLAVFYLPILFPDGRLPSARWRWAGWLAAAAIAAQSLALALSPGPVDASLSEVSNPFTHLWPWAESLLKVLNPLAIGLLLLGMAAAIAAPVARWRGARGVERAQMKWFALAVGVLAGTLAIPILIYYPDFTNDTLLSGLLLSIGFPILPVAVGIAVLRYHLYDIDILIRRTLIYSTLTALLALVYLVCVLVLQQVLRALTGATSSLAIVLSTLAIAALFTPLRRSVQRFIDRRFYRGQYDTDRVLAAFSTAVKHEVDLPHLTAMLLEAVDDSLHAENLSVWLLGKKTERR